MNNKKYLIILLSLVIAFVFISSQKISENKKDNSGKLYPRNVIDFSQNMLVYIKSELPYKSYIDTLENIDLNKLYLELNNHEKKLAFWLNTYNSLVQIRLIENPSLFEDKTAFFKNNDIIIGNEKLSLDDIENGILRCKKNVSNQNFTEKFKLNSIENRIHFTLNCGATSCPAIAYYKPNLIEKQLENATKFYVENNCEYNSDKNEIIISELFSWFKEDFNGEVGIINFLKKYNLIPKEEVKYVKIIYKEYDWGLKPGNFKE
ncbi:MAG: hypothetical protein CL844_05720 [Crocinitomicaceae bacterium]|nr:hypothetical protein [Crocinitomicaceae bacterium]|tara:strand:- start:9604 stop:10389 length:786 start_codon:yes stop_codon:yes gene_type:complete